MWRMFKMLPRRIKFLFFTGIFLILLNVAISLILPGFISQYVVLAVSSSETKIVQLKVFNKFIVASGTRDMMLTELTIISVILILLAFLTSFLSIVITTWGGERSSEFFRNKIFNKIQHLSLHDINKVTPESLITRISNDVAIFWELLISATNALIRAPLLIIGGIIFTIMTDPKLSLTIFLYLPILIVVLIIMIKINNPLLVKNQITIDKITKEVEENILGARLIKTFNLKEKQLRKFTEQNNKWLKLQTKINNVFAIGHPIFFVLINLVAVAIYALTAHTLFNSTTPDVQELANINVFLEYIFTISLGIILFSTFLFVFFRAKVSCARINEVLDFKNQDLKVEDGLSIEHTVDNITGLSVQFKNFNYKYFKDSEEYALYDINIDLMPGQTLGVIGPTGSGKSSLANLLINNYKYDTKENGHILVDNKEVNKINTSDLHKNIGIVYQDALLYSGTIKSNLLFAKQDATEDEINKALHNSCSIDFVQTFEDRTNHIVEQRAKNLSGGQKQRLSIARTLINDPKVLILDDSTSALDNITTKKLLTNIKQNYNCTTIIISQKISSIKHADQIIVLEKGRITGHGTHEELVEKNEWYRNTFTNQLEQ
ncbi:ABC transporter ATP-binding protein [Mycoplasmopsis anatis]|nr:ABC transporter ATP-binding protein [Mycoplasmopsis anatis]MBW0595172.1 ABC transporter ATP-binding protein [Mycoplasmopsis anatis]MBW0598129.1 ABC transporter ATP-binding protein [Mycoplasmopsis anatis]MBW0598939.1 ABC transporter ATP-binding protein [Mycoplasmopsis anatis]MBW0601227.1 ABC transporter ATP-binding protein [Mycoplasmopsis anatis]